MGASPRKNPVTAKTFSSSTSFTHASCAPAEPRGLIGANTGTTLRPLIPPLLLRSSRIAVYIFGKFPMSRLICERIDSRSTYVTPRSICFGVTPLVVVPADRTVALAATLLPSTSASTIAVANSFRITEPPSSGRGGTVAETALADLENVHHYLRHVGYQRFVVRHAVRRRRRVAR